MTHQIPECRMTMFLILKSIRKGTKWIGTHNGIASFDGLNWTVYDASNSGLPEDWVLDISIEQNGIIWIGHI